MGSRTTTDEITGTAGNDRSSHAAGTTRVRALRRRRPDRRPRWRQGPRQLRRRQRHASRPTSATSSPRTASSAAAAARSTSTASTRGRARRSEIPSASRRPPWRCAPRRPPAAGSARARTRATSQLTVTRDYGSKVLLQKTDSIHESDTVIRVLDRNADIDHPLRRRLRAVDRRARRRARAAAAAATGSSTSTGSSRRSARPSTTSPAATGSGGTTATGRRRCGCRPWSAPGRSRSCTASRASATAPTIACEGRDRRRATRSATSLRASRRAARDRGRLGETIHVLVGPWSGVRSERRRRGCWPRGPAEAASSPASSAPGSRCSSCSTSEGQPAGSIGTGGGLVAALRPGDGPPTWVVTGTDAKRRRGRRGRSSAPRCATTTRSRPSPERGADRGAGAVRPALAYTPGRSPLHRASPGASVAYLGALVAVAFIYSSPLVLLAAVVGDRAGRLRGGGRAGGPGLAAAGAAPAPAHGRRQRSGQPPRRHRAGPRLGACPCSAIPTSRSSRWRPARAIGLRVVAVVLAFAVYSACVDPDRVLRALRPVARRSALTAGLVTRLVPVAAADGARLREAAALRGPAPRRSVAPPWPAGWSRARSTAPSTSPRRSSCAGTRCPSGRGIAARALARRPCLCVTGAALALAAVAARIAGAGGFETYPRIEMDTGRARRSPSARRWSCWPLFRSSGRAPVRS